MDQRRRHAGEAQTLAGRGQQAGITTVLQGEELFLGGGPVRNQQIHQRRPGLEHITRRPGIDSLDEAIGAGLDYRHLAFIESEYANHLQAIGERAPGDGGQSQSEILGQAGVNANGRGLLSSIGVLRDHFHVHEGRLTRLVELLLRVHGVVPIQHLAAVLGRGDRLGRLARNRCHAGVGVPVAARQPKGDRQAAQQRTFPKSWAHGWFSP
ncbi:hypothetical protein D9M68_719170 [compost metagenome]